MVHVLMLKEPVTFKIDDYGLSKYLYDQMEFRLWDAFWSEFRTPLSLQFSEFREYGKQEFTDDNL